MGVLLGISLQVCMPDYRTKWLGREGESTSTTGDRAPTDSEYIDDGVHTGVTGLYRIRGASEAQDTPIRHAHQASLPNINVEIARSKGDTSLIRGLFMITSCLQGFMVQCVYVVERSI